MEPTAEMLEAARNCVKDWAQIRAGEQVLIFRTEGPATEPVVTETFRMLCAEMGAQAIEMIGPLFNPRVQEPPPAVARALEASDVVLFFSPYPALLHSKSGKKAMLEYGLRNVPVLTRTAEHLGSEWARFPVDLQLALHRKSVEAVSRDPRITVRGKNGTNMTGICPPVDRVTRWELIHGLAWKGSWPGECGPCLNPMIDMSGTLVIDVLPGFRDFLKEKVQVTVERNRIRAIEGGREARWFQDLVGKSVQEGSDADVLCELQWGVNPKGKIERAVLDCEDDEVEVSRIARTVHFGFGSGTRHFHWDTLVVDHFDVFMGDGTAIYEDGRLVHLDDPEIRNLAARFGDPDRVLAEISRLPWRYPEGGNGV